MTNVLKLEQSGAGQSVVEICMPGDPWAIAASTLAERIATIFRQLHHRDFCCPRL